MVHTIFAVACLLTSCLCALAAESLKNYWRSRLAALCRQRRQEVRFGEILRDDEEALFATQLLQLATLITGIALLWEDAAHGRGALADLPWWGLAILGVIGGWLGLRVLPWALSRVAGESILFVSWPLLKLCLQLLRPWRRFANRVDTLMHRLAGRHDPAPDDLESFTEELQSVVDEGEREGILESRAGKMIQRVMEMRSEDVRAVMTPRTDIISIQVSSSLTEARRELLEAGHSRIPVVDGSADDIVGILYARDLLESFGQSQDRPLREIVRPPFYVPETTTIEKLLEQMKRERLHLAIVLDEYGGVTGLVTLEDILEEIVGDIADEFDEREDELYQWIDAHTLWIDARMHLDELNELFDLTFPEDRDFDTIGGFVFAELGRIPKPGEQLTVGDVRISVLDASPRKLIRLELFSTVPWPQSESAPAAESRDQPSGADSDPREVKEDGRATI